MRELEIRLISHGYPDGELGARKAGRLSESVDELMYRLTRHAAGAEGLGRQKVIYERLADVRLAGIEPGSARLIFHLGDQETLDTDPISELTTKRFWDVVEGLARNERPDFVTEPIAGAVDSFARAAKVAAASIQVTMDDRVSEPIITALIDRVVWAPHRGVASEATLTGRLEMVDLYTSHFRIVDDVGNRIELHDVQDAEEAANLVTTRVLAHGRFQPATGAGRPRLDEATVRRFETPDSLADAFDPVPIDLAYGTTELETLPDDLALSDAELARFLAAIDE